MLMKAILSVAVFAQMASAQGATITGLVHDSISHAPLAGAEIQLVPANDPSSLAHTATSDSLGRFALSNVPKGRYALGFLHPMLDSLGVDIPLREVIVDDNRSMRVDLGIPGGAKLRRAICGNASTKDSVGVIVGFVRDAASDMPVAGVSVITEWLELVFSAGGFVRKVPRLVATTGDNGWFAVCNVPVGGTMSMLASKGSDSTGAVEVQMPAEGFARRDLVLGPSETVVVEDNAPRADTAAKRPPQRIRVGNARLSGTVVAAVEGNALGGAVVGIVNGPQTRANERGEWVISNAPVGTRMLEVRAIGYYPVRRTVNVAAAGSQVKVALSTMKAVLDTVRVSASRTYDRNMIDFEKRRRSGLGRYLTAADILRHHPVTISDALRMVPGVFAERGETGMTLAVRGMFSDRCSPAVYIDDRYMWDMSGDELDAYIKPDHIAGIEIYSGTMVPPQYQPPMLGCGSIVIWTK